MQPNHLKQLIDSVISFGITPNQNKSVNDLLTLKKEDFSLEKIEEIQKSIKKDIDKLNNDLNQKDRNFIFIILLSPIPCSFLSNFLVKHFGMLSGFAIHVFPFLLIPFYLKINSRIRDRKEKLKKIENLFKLLHIEVGPFSPQANENDSDSEEIASTSRLAFS